MRPVDWGWVRAPTAQPRPESFHLILAFSPGAGVAGRLGGAGQHLGQTYCFLGRFIQRMCDTLLLVTEAVVPSASYQLSSTGLLCPALTRGAGWGWEPDGKGRGSVRLQAECLR